MLGPTLLLHITAYLTNHQDFFTYDFRFKILRPISCTWSHTHTFWTKFQTLIEIASPVEDAHILKRFGFIDETIGGSNTLEKNWLCIGRGIPKGILYDTSDRHEIQKYFIGFRPILLYLSDHRQSHGLADLWFPKTSCVDA